MKKYMVLLSIAFTLVIAAGCAQPPIPPPSALPNGQKIDWQPAEVGPLTIDEEAVANDTTGKAQATIASAGPVIPPMVWWGTWAENGHYHIQWYADSVPNICRAQVQKKVNGSWVDMPGGKINLELIPDKESEVEHVENVRQMNFRVGIRLDGMFEYRLKLYVNPFQFFPTEAKVDVPQVAVWFYEVFLNEAGMYQMRYQFQPIVGGNLDGAGVQVVFPSIALNTNAKVYADAMWSGQFYCIIELDPLTYNLLVGEESQVTRFNFFIDGDNVPDLTAEEKFNYYIPGGGCTCP